MTQSTDAPDGALAVLAVYDDPGHANLLSQILRSEGHRVMNACDGASAIRAVFKEAPDIAVLDIGLPDRDGYAVARDLCCLLRERPLLVATTDTPGLGDRSRREGFDLHFQKPLDFCKVARSVTILARSRRPLATNLTPKPGVADRRIKKRKSARSSLKIFCYQGSLALGPNLATGLVDVSETGIRLRVRSNLRSGQDVCVRIEGQSHLRPVSRSGTVVWCARCDATYEAGVRFKTPLYAGEVLKIT